jgi:hypothetical protein
MEPDDAGVPIMRRSPTAVRGSLGKRVAVRGLQGEGDSRRERDMV